MMSLDKFKKPYSYVVQVKDKYWYLVQQNGQRSWEALMFTHTSAEIDRAEWIPMYLHGNATSLADELSKMDVTNAMAGNTNVTLRKAIYNVCKYGKLIPPNEEEL